MSSIKNQSSECDDALSDQLRVEDVRVEEILEHVFTPLSGKYDTCDFRKITGREIRTEKFRTTMFSFD